ncbi:hypothetical protein N0V84_004065 [Fusarium piperis]|uniref:Uncharacterized protein n=1 Tax=Fusarium piperis TaxID=1435070 RepID=A0A9W8WGK6_9HYPO|nr:hypothetical protein N0V84_004065 [Fusarium piperis]
MKFLSFLLVSAAVAVNAVPQGETVRDRWCNDGTPSDGGCERNGQKAYCCHWVDYSVPGYRTLRPTTVLSRGPDGVTVQCTSEGNIGGQVYCAP